MMCLLSLYRMVHGAWYPATGDIRPSPPADHGMRRIEVRCGGGVGREQASRTSPPRSAAGACGTAWWRWSAGWSSWRSPWPLGSVSGQRTMTEDQYATGDSARAIQILDDAGLKTPAGELILLTGTGSATSPATRAAVTDLTTRLGADRRSSPACSTPTANDLVSADGRSVLVRLAMTGDPMTAADRVQPILDAVAATRSAHPDVRIDEFGDGSANRWFNDTIGKDFQRAEWTAVPLALGILLVAFGAFLAAVLPVGLALTSFLAANGMLAVVSQRLPLDSSTSSVMLLVGLAVGVDYCMFYLRREREERAQGRDPETALHDRGRDVRPLGAGLRADRGGGDVRDVPVRAAALRRLRGGRDPRRPGRGARLGDGAARAAVDAGRPGRLRPGAGAGPDAAPDRRAARSGARSSAGCSSGPGCRCSAAVALPARARDADGGDPHRAARPRQAAAGRRQHHAELPPDHRGLPRRAEPGPRGRDGVGRGESGDDGRRRRTSAPGRSPPV